MDDSILEAKYPISFHEKEAKKLGEHLRNRHNVVLIGMKRVGISNFLRFFLYHPAIVDTYIHDGYQHMFIHVDLNDLVEREIGPFWILALKRIADTVEISTTASPELKKQIASIFLESIQTQDIFLTIDSIRRCCSLLSQHGYMPTVFFITFDRIKDAATPEFFANLQGLRDATHGKLSYVFTSFRSLDVVAPHAFPRASLIMFSHDMYIQPAAHKDASIIFETYKKRYQLEFAPELEAELIPLIDGYVRYLNLALIVLNEKKEQQPVSEAALSQLLSKDERIYLQSEELWESLAPDEQAVLCKIVRGEALSTEDDEAGKYLFDTGMVAGDKTSVFSPLFAKYVASKSKTSAAEAAGVVEFTKKEHMLFDFLKKHVGEVAEREAIIEAVWPEVEELGVSDWAIDRLVARVRSKLKLQKSDFEIQTIKTRGYKLISLT